MPTLEAVWYTWVRPRNGLPYSWNTNYSKSEWEWFRQVAEVIEEDSDISDPFSATVSFRLNRDDYWIRFTLDEWNRSRFPECSPSLNGSFMAGFEFEWEKTSRLADILNVYREYAATIDNILVMLDSICRGDIRLLGYDIDEEEKECMRVRLELPNCEAVLLMCLSSPYDFPQSISLSNVSLMRLLKPDSWDSEDPFSENFDRLFDDILNVRMEH